MAQMELARHFGFRSAMITSKASRLDYIRGRGIHAIDRREFGELTYDRKKMSSDPEYKERYKTVEKRFLSMLYDFTQGERVSIFVDHIGEPVLPATLKALAYPAVIATCGWKHGMKISFLRALECVKWHTHVHTHMARYRDVVDSARFAVENDWIPDVTEDTIFDWEDVPKLAALYNDDALSSYFPLYRINGV